MSKKVPSESTESIEPAKESAKYILKERVIDKYTVARTRVKLTPSMCDICAFDVIERNNLTPYEDMSEELRSQVRDAIKKHKEIAHPSPTAHIIDQDELPREWLGRPRKVATKVTR